jgi:hypothetical protein
MGEGGGGRGGESKKLKITEKSFKKWEIRVRETDLIFS